MGGVFGVKASVHLMGAAFAMSHKMQLLFIVWIGAKLVAETYHSWNLMAWVWYGLHRFSFSLVNNGQWCGKLSVLILSTVNLVCQQSTPDNAYALFCKLMVLAENRQVLFGWINYCKYCIRDWAWISKNRIEIEIPATKFSHQTYACWQEIPSCFNRQQILSEPGWRRHSLFKGWVILKRLIALWKCQLSAWY